MKKYSITSSLLFISLVLAPLSLAFLNFSIFLVGFIGFFILCLSFRKMQMNKVFFAVFVIQCIFLLITYFGYLGKYGKPYYLGGSDDFDFEKMAMMCVENNVYTFGQASHTDPIMFSDGKTYVLFLSYLMRFSSFFGGYHTISARLINVLLLDFIAAIFACLFPNNKNRLIVFLLIALFPSCIYISIHVFRDVISCFFLALLYFLLRIVGSGRLKLSKQ